jgi:excisionase family DNA binding protein
MTRRTMADLAADPEALLFPAEVAALFRVDPKTVTRWARDGRLPYLRTIGGHRRYRAADVLAAAVKSTVDNFTR